MRSPLKTFGGKSRLAQKIIKLMPPAETYIEGCCAGFSVGLNLLPGWHGRRIANDINPRIINFWRVLRDSQPALSDFLSGIDYTQENWDLAEEWECSNDPVEAAAGYMIRGRFSRSGQRKVFSWSDRLRGSQPENINSWHTIRASLPKISASIQDVLFFNVDVCSILDGYDNKTSLFYLDPPYLHETRTADDDYEYEMSFDYHEKMLKLINQVQGKVMISGYMSDLYANYLYDWTLVKFNVKNNSGQGKTKQDRTECLWLNY